MLDKSGFPLVISEMKSLKTLDLTYSSLQNITEHIGKAYKLTALFLSNNPSLESVDAALGKCPLKGFLLFIKLHLI